MNQDLYNKWLNTMFARCRKPKIYHFIRKNKKHNFFVPAISTHTFNAKFEVVDSKLVTQKEDLPNSNFQLVVSKTMKANK